MISLVLILFVGKTDTFTFELNEEYIEYEEMVTLELVIPELMYVGSSRQIRCFSSTIAFFDVIIMTIDGINHTAATINKGLLSQHPYDLRAESERIIKVTCTAYLNDELIASERGEIEIISN